LKQPQRNKKEKKKKPVQQIERFFLPIFWEYNPKKNAVASLFLFDEFYYPSQKTIEKKRSQCTRYKTTKKKKKKKNGGWFSIISPKY
jgi:hypothetical protein